MPGLQLPAGALRPGKSPVASPVSSPARNLPGTLLPLTGQGTPSSRSPSKAPAINLKALIPDHVDEDIRNRYEIDKEQLGAGGYGSVFLAKDKKMAGRLVAIKKAIMLDSEMRENFQQEVHIMKELDHPNICTVYESYDDGRYVYLVMEYCSGGDLFDYLLRQSEKQENLPEVQVIEVVRQVTSALMHAHDKGIAHRDLKPENVCFENSQDRGGVQP